MASIPPTHVETDQVLVEAKASARIFTLNRPKQLNALSFTMLSRLMELFLACAEDSSVKLIILQGKGRAFCAGGDVVDVRDANQGNWKLGEIFFRKEYTLNYVMATYSKPQVSILNGIVMGGGAGASIHGRFRVATENSIFAMPETALGHFPDVGASYLLAQRNNFNGEYVGLTGKRLDGAEMLACGLATHFVPSEKLSLLKAALCKADSSDPDVISSIISGSSKVPKLKEKSVYHRLNTINKCVSQRTIEDIIVALAREYDDKKDEWVFSTIQLLKKASPTSLKISLRSIREGRLEGIGKCLTREFRMVCHILRCEVNKDFIEGCRDILIDKDNNPKWEPSDISKVNEQMVDHYFSKVNDDDWEDLKLPVKSNLPAYAIAKL